MSFIVIEGLDGSGKTTQLNRLKEYLQQHNISYQYLHFPRTEDGLFGDLVARFLRGDLGTIDQVNPYLVGLIYAGDREHSKSLINKWVSEGELVIVDRYVYSNMAFQGAKLKTMGEKVALRKWLNQLEYEYFGIPKPDLSIFMDVPFSFTTNNLSKDRQGDDRDYLHGKKDIHEDDLGFQENVRQEYLSLIEQDSSFKLIKCYNDSLEMLQPEETFNLILVCLKTNHIIK